VNKTRAAMLFVLALASAPALPANWVPLGTDARGNTWHVDSHSIQHDRGSVTAWKRIEFKKPYPHFRKGTPLKSAFVLNAIDCVGQRTDLKAIGLLDHQGSVIAVHESGAGDVPWPPGVQVALLEKAMALICTLGNVPGHQ